ncbi:MAG TPA: glycerol-3-phosphate 1-O-acyltransferase PlsY [Burkholderiaceae bacterium]|nr:glycerol-3-phosphate 1-O-acyltransferase PlsY [Burkholderiaceae bacterium]
MSWLSSVAIVAGSYLLGSLSFAVIVSRAMGLDDPRGYGSGNPGATNVLRSGNRTAAIATLVLDALKGSVAVMLAALAAPRLGYGGGTVALAGLAAFIGHLYPVFFRFRGGKGVATAAGVLLALEPWLGLACLAAWLAVAAITRRSSLAALVAALLAPVLDVLAWGATERTGPIAVMSLLLVWRHRLNIGRLLAGTEPRLGARVEPSQEPPAEPSRRDAK